MYMDREGYAEMYAREARQQQAEEAERRREQAREHDRIFCPVHRAHMEEARQRSCKIFGERMWAQINAPRRVTGHETD